MTKFMFVFFVFCCVIFSFNPTFAEDIIEEDIVADGDDGAVTAEDVEAEEESDSPQSTSPYADTILLFTKPSHTPGQQMDLPAGKSVEFLIGFANKGPNEFVVETIEASFRYPMDFNYYIQNFSAVAYNREVKPGLEATISYSFMPSDNFAGRPFGLNIAMNYRDSNGVQYMESVFNETVLISEIDEGLDGETFFLYVLMAGIVVLLLVVGQQYLLGSSGKRKRTAIKKTIETGTGNDNSIDYEWLPQETLRVLQKSPSKSKTPKTSPKPNKETQSPKTKKAVKQQ